MKKHTEELFKAVENFIKKEGGNPLVIGNVSIAKRPLKYNYQIRINFTGAPPKTKKDKDEDKN